MIPYPRLFLLQTFSFSDDAVYCRHLLYSLLDPFCRGAFAFGVCVGGGDPRNHPFSFFSFFPSSSCCCFCFCFCYVCRLFFSFCCSSSAVVCGSPPNQRMMKMLRKMKKQLSPPLISTLVFRSSSALHLSYDLCQSLVRLLDAPPRNQSL